MVLCFNSLR